MKYFLASGSCGWTLRLARLRRLTSCSTGGGEATSDRREEVKDNLVWAWPSMKAQNYDSPGLHPAVFRATCHGIKAIELEEVEILDPFFRPEEEKRNDVVCWDLKGLVRSRKIRSKRRVGCNPDLRIKLRIYIYTSPSKSQRSQILSARIEVARLAGVHIDNPLTQLHRSLAADFFRRKTLLLNVLEDIHLSVSHASALSHSVPDALINFPVHKDKRLNETNSSIFTHLSHRLGALSQTCSVPPTLQGFNNQR
nr:hypothetical protein Iba_chr13dCG3150 [Ipomoea batatas]